jgi:hypothetical protein
MRRAVVVLAMLGVLLSNGCFWNKNSKAADATKAASNATSEAAALASDPMISSLTTGLGLNANQAIGGAGALLGLAQTNMASGDWSKVAAAIPGASNLISQAKTLGGISKFTNLADLSGAFTKMGLTADQAKGITSSLTDTISKAAGPEIGTAFAAAIK